jgi:hypothetical protein
MSEPEHALARWSRLKREAAAQEKAAEKAKAGTTSDPPSAQTTAAGKRDGEAGAPSGTAGPASTPTFDPSDLPPIDAIGVDTDIRAFLQPGVPATLTRAALRRAWTIDPAIRDFIEIAENQWDFNNPTSIPGFGHLASEDVPDLLARAFGSSNHAPEPIAASYEAAPEQATVNSSPGPKNPGSEQNNADSHAGAANEPEIQVAPRTETSEAEGASAASQHERIKEQSKSELDAPRGGVRRTHGTALPS